MHRGTFVESAARPGEVASPLRGEGAVEVLPGGLRVQGRAVRTTLVNVLTGLTAFVLMVTCVVATVVIAEELALDVPMKAGVALGLLGVLVGWTGGGWLFARVLPLRAIDHTIPFAYLVSGRAVEGGVELASTDPACPGRFTLRTADPGALLAALEHAKRGR